jgi:hypothetical protein
LINNRQGGRRRGRGGQRPQGMGGQSSGNRQDNRQRGNAAQLLEKYKSMARDAQLAGDRVQTEYFLQFADHYYRVLGESRSRFEDQRPRSRDDEDLGEEGDEEMLETADEQQGDTQQPRGRDYEDRGPRRDRPDRSARGDRPDRAERPRRFNRDDRDDDRPARAERNGAEQFDQDQDQDEERIAFDVLPPAIGATGGDAPEAEAEEAPRPRRAARKPRAKAGDDDIAPAA